MYQYWYLNSNGNGEQYNNQIAMSSLYLQQQIAKAEGMNDLKVPENWSCRVDPFGWDSPANYTGFNPGPPPFPLGQPIHYAGMIPQGHAANWAPLQGHAIIQGCSHKVISPLYYHRQSSLFILIPIITGVFLETIQAGEDR